MSIWPRIGRFALAPVRGGRFSPVDIAPGAAALRLCAELQTLPWPDGATLYLRGSRLEESLPHPSADLDMVCVVDDPSVRLAAWRAIEPWIRRQTWQVDAHATRAVDVDACGATRLLLATRSLRVLGPPLAFRPVPADWSTMHDHGLRYGVWRVPDNLAIGVRARVAELKALTRAWGVLRFLEDGVFSRDVATCLRWAEQASPTHGAVLRNAWTTVGEPRPRRVADIRDALLRFKVLQPAG